MFLQYERLAALCMQYDFGSALKLRYGTALYRNGEIIGGCYLNFDVELAGAYTLPFN